MDCNKEDRYNKIAKENKQGRNKEGIEGDQKLNNYTTSCQTMTNLDDQQIQKILNIEKRPQNEEEYLQLDNIIETKKSNKVSPKTKAKVDTTPQKSAGKTQQSKNELNIEFSDFKSTPTSQDPLQT